MKKMCHGTNSSQTVSYPLRTKFRVCLLVRHSVENMTLRKIRSEHETVWSPINTIYINKMQNNLIGAKYLKKKQTKRVPKENAYGGYLCIYVAVMTRSRYWHDRYFSVFSFFCLKERSVVYGNDLDPTAAICRSATIIA